MDCVRERFIVLSTGCKYNSCSLSNDKWIILPKVYLTNQSSKFGKIRIQNFLLQWPKVEKTSKPWYLRSLDMRLFGISVKKNTWITNWLSKLLKTNQDLMYFIIFNPVLGLFHTTVFRVGKFCLHQHVFGFIECLVSACLRGQGGEYVACHTLD